ncbi:omega-amidase NIT2-like [Episyrphus balteatus]|uniref:omega-amidase NIT2-like n=1 Tax=Episyrphus balteatus TaxID=286459 RepID=UPI0024851370|nr:omega-amidase NIT2-like [Episyrphus balteatus]
MKIALLQLPVGSDPTTNVNRAVEAVKQAKAKNPDLKVAILPECFNGPYGTEFFAQYAEKVPQGPTCQVLSKLAKSLGLYLIGGTVIEQVDGGDLFNTCTVWSPDGKLIGKYRKMHLFDVSSEDGTSMQFNESSALKPGNEFMVFEIENRKFGIGICHDMRFDEFARVYRKEGCDIIVYPSSFCIAHGPMYWELLQRSRANDNHVFVVTVSSARDENADYVSYGHSMVVDPCGRVMCEASEKCETVIADIDFTMVDDIRKQIPIYGQRRTDIYDTIKMKK